MLSRHISPVRLHHICHHGDINGICLVPSSLFFCVIFLFPNVNTATFPNVNTATAVTSPMYTARFFFRNYCTLGPLLPFGAEGQLWHHANSLTLHSVTFPPNNWLIISLLEIFPQDQLPIIRK